MPLVNENNDEHELLGKLVFNEESVDDSKHDLWIRYGTDWIGDQENEYSGYFINTRGIGDRIIFSGNEFYLWPDSESIDSDDRFFSSSGLGGLSEVVFLGKGDDYIFANAKDDELYGGSGNDEIYGGDGADVIYGDYANIPIAETQDKFEENFLGTNVVKTGTFEGFTTDGLVADLTITGDDYLDGGTGADRISGGPGIDTVIGGNGDDTLIGGADDDFLGGGKGDDSLLGQSGNDLLYSGPRGQGDQDTLTGGDGADAFYLGGWESVSEDVSTDWWTKYGVPVTAGAGADAIKEATKVATGATLGVIPVVGPALSNIVSGAVGTVAKIAITDALSNSAEETDTSPNDTAIITDFDPRVDVIFMPYPDTVSGVFDTSITPSAKRPGSSDDTWAAQLTVGGNEVGLVFFDEGFMDDMGVSDASSDTHMEDLFNNVFNHPVIFDDDGMVTNSYLSSGTPGDDDLDLTAPDGTEIAVFGAIGPQVIYGGSSTNTTLRMSGSEMGDIISVQPGAFNVDNWATASLTSFTTFVAGWGGDDLIIGGGGRDFLSGGDGDDQIWAFQTTTNDGLTFNVVFGGDGNDTLYGGGGDTKFFGGDHINDLTNYTNDGGYFGEDNHAADGDTDTVSFEYSDGSVFVNLSSTSRASGLSATGSIAAGAGLEVRTTTSDTFKYNLEFADIQDITGTGDDDTIIGSAQANRLEGRAGDDTIDGGGGDDTLIGGAGADWVAGGGGNDTILGQSNDDTLFGHAGFDTIDGGEGNDIIDGGEGNDTLDGGEGNDTIFGRAGIDTIDGGEGNDIIDGGHGNDRITGGNGDDTIDGGDSDDTLIGGVGADTVVGGEGNDTILGQSQADSLQGNNGNDTIDGGEGADTIDGGQGADTIDGGIGDDLIIGSIGEDIIDGGDGTDTVDYSDGGFTRIAANLVTGEVLTYHPEASAVEQTDSVANVEKVTGTSGNDDITGSAQANRLEGREGDDFIGGGGGDDTIVWNYGDGNDVISGGDGFDGIVVNLDDGTSSQVDFFASASSSTDAAFSVDRYVDDSSREAFLDSPDTLGDYYSTFGTVENLTVNADPDAGEIVFDGSLATAGISHNTIFVNGAADASDVVDASGITDGVRVVVTGNGGNDTMIGGTGDDIFYTSEGDTASGGSGNDQYFGLGAVSGFEDGEMISFDGKLVNNIRSIRDGVFEVIFKDGSRTTIEAELSERELERFEVSSGDRISITEAKADTQIKNGGNSTRSDDEIYGSDDGDRLLGRSGDDILDGNGGDDRIDGGHGNDTLLGGYGNDEIRARHGDDFVDGGSGADQIFGDQGNDTLRGGRGDDIVKGGTGDDLVGGGNGNDILYGGSGNDTLLGRKGADILIGGVGEDIFQFARGEGVDTVRDFREGVDLISIVSGESFEDLSFEGETISLNETPIAVLTGIDTTMLEADNFLFS